MRERIHGDTTVKRRHENDPVVESVFVLLGCLGILGLGAVGYAAAIWSMW